ncbi:MAG: hypothetical protein Q9212_001931 [Teloschistes hypoglaucus]
MPFKEHSLPIRSTPSRKETPANSESSDRADSMPYIPTIEGTLGRDKTLDERVTGTPCPPHQKGTLVVKVNAEIQKALRKAERARAPSPSYKGINPFRAASLANTPTKESITTSEPATPVSVSDTNQTPQKDDLSSPIGAAIFSTARPSTFAFATTPLTTTTPSPDHRASSPPGSHTPCAPHSTRKSEAWHRKRLDPAYSTHPNFIDFTSSPPDAGAIFSTARPSTLNYQTTPLTTTTPSPNHRATTPPGSHTPAAPSTRRTRSEFYLRRRKVDRSPSRRYMDHKEIREAHGRSRSASPARTPVKKSAFAEKLQLALSDRGVPPSQTFVEKLMEAGEKELPRGKEAKEGGVENVKGKSEMGPPATPAKRATDKKKTTGAMGPPPSPSTTRVADPFVAIAPPAPSTPATTNPSTPRARRAPPTMLQGLFTRPKNLTKGLKRAATSPAKPSPVKEETEEERMVEKGEAPEPRTPSPRKRVKGNKK